jgi:UDP-N-acetylmuramoylalanine--D-glutamate ligase
VKAARKQGVPVSSMTRLFFERCSGITVGVTGSSGKSTTTALIGEMFAASGRKSVVGGNIGVGLLGLLDEITPDTWVIVELSHTQLETIESSPHIACVLNVTPNHLDRYSWEEYAALKLRILRHQTKDDIAVLSLDDEVTSAFATEAPGHVVWFSARRVPTGDGAYVQDGAITWRKNGVETKVLDVSEIPLRGAHNVSNVVAALATAAAAGVEFEAIARAVREFHPPPHRIELIAEIGGVTYYNDSIATTPERTLAALRSFEEPLVLLLGGRGKKLPLDELAAESVAGCRAVVCFGEAGPEIERALRQAGGSASAEVAVALPDAMAVAAKLAEPGDVVLLSPACTSYDAYNNFEERGEHFRSLVRDLCRGRVRRR